MEKVAEHVAAWRKMQLSDQEILDLLKGKGVSLNDAEEAMKKPANGLVVMSNRSLWKHISSILGAVILGGVSEVVLFSALLEVYPFDPLFWEMGRLTVMQFILGALLGLAYLSITEAERPSSSRLRFCLATLMFLAVSFVGAVSFMASALI